MLLFLHGGPGDVTNPWAFTVFAPWEEHFTVVQWDQRGAGRTLRRTGPAIAATLTVERLVQDGIELAEHLLETLGKDKLLLVGHSFGSILGALARMASCTLVARRRDDRGPWSERTRPDSRRRAAAPRASRRVSC